MKPKLVITLSEEATAEYLKIASARTTAEVDADCTPSGATLSIDIAPAFLDSHAYLGDDELGIAEVELKE